MGQVTGPALSGAELEALIAQGPCCSFGVILRALAEPEVLLFLAGLLLLFVGLGVLLIRFVFFRRPRKLEFHLG